MHRLSAHRSELLLDRASAIAWHWLGSQDARDAQQIRWRGCLVDGELSNGMADELRCEILYTGQGLRQRRAVHHQPPVLRRQLDRAILRHRDDGTEGCFLLIDVATLMKQQPDEPGEVPGEGD